MQIYCFKVLITVFERLPPLRHMFFFLCLQLDVQNDVCSLQSMTLEGCFHIHLLEVESVFELSENPVLMDCPASVIVSSSPLEIVTKKGGKK